MQVRGMPLRMHSSPLLLWSGSILYLVLLVIALGTGARVDFNRSRMLQFIGRDELQAASWSELLNIHSQPPGFNALLKLFDQFGAQSDEALLAAFVIMTVIGVWMTADITYRLSGSLRWGTAAGLFAGGVPGTLFYSMWVFYTLPTALLLTTAVWGMVRSSRSGSVLALTVSILAVVFAALTRSTITWVLVIAWIVFNVSTIRRVFGGASTRQRLLSAVVMIVSLLAFGAIQVHAFATFGSVTLSSWGFESSAKALQTTMSDDEIESVAATDSCLLAVVRTGVFRPVNEYPLCAGIDPSPVGHSSPLLTQYYWSDGSVNMNHIGRLSLTDEWFTFTLRALSDDPTRVVRILLPSLVNEERGTIVRFLWPSSWYWLIEKNVQIGGLLTTFWIVTTSWIPVAMLTLIVVGVIRTRKLWADDLAGRQMFRTAAGAVIVMTMLYLILETGENERFRAEIDWLLIALGMSVVARIRSSRKGLVPLDSRGFTEDGFAISTKDASDAASTNT